MMGVIQCLMADTVVLWPVRHTGLSDLHSLPIGLGLGCREENETSESDISFGPVREPVHAYRILRRYE